MASYPVLSTEFEQGKTPSCPPTPSLYLPARDGGLGILSPMATAYDEYDHSRSATAPLAQLIIEGKR